MPIDVTNLVVWFLKSSKLLLHGKVMYDENYATNIGGRKC